MLRVSRLTPSQSRPPHFLTHAAKLQSSMISPRMASNPPALSKISGRNNIHTAAAPATRLRGFATADGGYKRKNKYTNAEHTNVHARVGQVSRSCTEPKAN